MGKWKKRKGAYYYKNLFKSLTGESGCHCQPIITNTNIIALWEEGVNGKPQGEWKPTTTQTSPVWLSTFLHRNIRYHSTGSEVSSQFWLESYPSRQLQLHHNNRVLIFFISTCLLGWGWASFFYFCWTGWLDELRNMSWDVMRTWLIS